MNCSVLAGLCRFEGGKKNPLMCSGNLDTSVICATKWQELMNHASRQMENNINEWRRRRREGENRTLQILNKKKKKILTSSRRDI